MMRTLEQKGHMFCVIVPTASQVWHVVLAVDANLNVACIFGSMEFHN
jgi:hypothetical protein